MRPSKGVINLANLRTLFGHLFEEIEFTANAKSLSAKETGGGTGKVVEKKLTLDKNLLSVKYFHKMLFHQITTNQTKINKLKITLCHKCELMRPSRGMINIANLGTMFCYLLTESEFTTNAKRVMQVSACKTAMKKFHTSYMHSSFFCHLLICHHSINASNCSKYCN